MPIWNPWHGCRKISPGCVNCYVYRRDAEFGKDSSLVEKTANFDLPLRKNRQRAFKLLPGKEPVYTCMTSDFFIEEADEWRPEIWKMIRERADLTFVIITKRIDRFRDCIPDDWNEGYENVCIMCTCENQERADYRLPIFLSLPIRHRAVIHEPMLEEIHIEKYLSEGKIDQVICGGESGNHARVCDFAWILASRKQCLDSHTGFYFKQTGAKFRMDGKIYRIDRKYQMTQADRADCNYYPDGGERWYETDSSQHEDGNLEELFARLANSKFRSGFMLKQKDKEYIREKGLDVIRSHAVDFIRERLAPAQIPNDGKQTPMKGHPAFVAQHATGTCCRNCLCKWHKIQPGIQLNERQQEYCVDVIMEWIRRQLLN